MGRGWQWLPKPRMKVAPVSGSENHPSARLQGLLLDFGGQAAVGA